MTADSAVSATPDQEQARLALAGESEAIAVGGASSSRTRKVHHSRRTTILVFLWKYLVGMVLCQSAVGSVLVVGWTYRLMQRSVRKRWWKASRLRRDGGSLASYLCAVEPEHRGWPNWIVLQDFGREFAVGLRQARGVVGKLRFVVRAVFGSLGANLKLGIGATLNTWLLTMPACALWLVAWYDGWNNSFHKGYEQAAVGPLTGLAGVALFIVAMLYVPMAQARQASTGSWRSYFEFGLIWGLVARHRLRCLGLVALYFVVSLPITVLKTAPAFFPLMFPSLEAMSDAELLRIGQVYFFASAAVVFPAYVALHLAAARLYGTALLAAARDRRVAPSDLAPDEARALHALDLFEQRELPRRHIVVRTARRTAGLTLGTALLVVTMIVWFGFVAQIFVSEFFNFHPGVGWLNQPLVQLPWFHYVPGHLQP